MDKKADNIRNFAWGMALYSGASILGPIVVIGGIGYVLDRILNAKHVILLLSIAVAFVVTNILIFRKSKLIMDEIKNIKTETHAKNGYDEEEGEEK